ncbi:KEOPS complex subunit Pcc1 [Halosegnis marinus]|uniref:KEOPS complex subunit Pcc1 n=1 Tax=Halosegnis marinus TaxID=3034023 RepID=A0ABD5ZSD2_9EURY|nr:KEOPS complex subunit Pcc1 [Halosegnis sp. DT85]
MRRATFRTEHDDAALVAAAVAPDNTPEVETTVEGSTVVTTIERETTGGLRATADDYVSNLAVAQRITEHDIHNNE